MKKASGLSDQSFLIHIDLSISRGHPIEDIYHQLKQRGFVVKVLVELSGELGKGTPAGQRGIEYLHGCAFALYIKFKILVDEFLDLLLFFG